MTIYASGLMAPEFSTDVRTGVASRAILGASIWLFLAIPALAADQGNRTGQRLSSELFVEQVISANAGLAAGESRLAAARSRASYAGSLDDPQLSYAIAPASVANSIGTRQIVQFSQQFPWRGQLRDRSEVAAGEVALVDSQWQSYRVQLIAEARTRWTEWWYLHQALSLNAANGALIEQLIPVTESIYGAGRGLQQDVLQAQTRRERIRLERLRLQQKKRRLQAGMNALQGAAPNAAVSAPAPLPTWRKLPSYEELRNRVADNDPRLQQLAARSRSAAAKQTLATKAYYPDLRGSVAYIGTLDPEEKRLQLGLSFTLPINRGRLAAAVDAATAERASIDHERADTEVRVDAELAQALLAAEEATQASVIYRQSLIPKARQSLEAAQADYEAIRGDFSNVILAESQLLELQLELARTRADWRIAVAGIERITNAGLWSMTDSTTLAEPRLDDVLTAMEGMR